MFCGTDSYSLFLNNSFSSSTSFPSPVLLPPLAFVHPLPFSLALNVTSPSVKFQPLTVGFLFLDKHQEQHSHTHMPFYNFSFSPLNYIHRSLNTDVHASITCTYIYNIYGCQIISFHVYTDIHRLNTCRAHSCSLFSSYFSPGMTIHYVCVSPSWVSLCPVFQSLLGCFHPELQDPRDHQQCYCPDRGPWRTPGTRKWP